MSDDLLAEERDFVRTLVRTDVSARLDHLRQFRAIVASVAESLKEKRKELRRAAGEADCPLATFLLTEETRLLIALFHAEKVGLAGLKGDVDPEDEALS